MKTSESISIVIAVSGIALVGFLIYSAYQTEKSIGGAVGAYANAVGSIPSMIQKDIQSFISGGVNSAEAIGSGVNTVAKTVTGAIDATGNTIVSDAQQSVNIAAQLSGAINKAINTQAVAVEKGVVSVANSANGAIGSIPRTVQMGITSAGNAINADIQGLFQAGAATGNEFNNFLKSLGI